MSGLLGVDHLVRGLLSQPQRAGARTQSRNTLGINHPLAESSPVARIPLSMMPFIGGGASGYTQEDLATLQLPEETTLFSPLGFDITDKDLARFGLATDALDWVPGAAVLGGLATGAGLLGRAVKGNRVAPESDEMMSAMIGPAMQRQGLLDDAMVTYHGSPHRFDEFDMSKLGTGEGAQAYGHGLYFAESKDVAQTYQPRDFDAEEIMMARYKEAVNAGDYNRADQWESAMLHETPDDLRERSLDMDYDEDYRQAAAEVAEELAAIPSSSSLYTVDIPDEAIAKMLDWDAPLSEQPESVQKAFAKLGGMNEPLDRLQADYLAKLPDEAKTIARSMIYGDESARLGDASADNWRKLDELSPGVDHNAIHDIADNMAGITGERLYWDLVDYRIDDAAKASEALRAAGIPGIKYYDGGSRTAGEGTRNFVVFDDKLPTILKRND